MRIMDIPALKQSHTVRRSEVYKAILPNELLWNNKSCATRNFYLEYGTI